VTVVQHYREKNKLEKEEKKEIHETVNKSE